ncbi:MFS transporter [Streptomyces capitiformicae]|uniref:Actinorhodin transporter n=1 Tax=Streptomyces capitiformicae TaxID=2014920 RepID=A0A918ZXK8_9ACTN|nr:MFS transporter [Streptomyces capitiformicae]GHE73159.1 putative actinorhodin transporter [Streptomyces capitiformicae]
MSGTAEASGVSLRDDRPGASQVPKGAWFVLFTLLAASMMDMLDATAMGVAAPAIKLDLGASDAQFQWINIGYLLSFSVLLLAGGRLGDIVGRRRVFLIGLAGFTVTSVACAAAQSPAELIVARLLQGCAAAMMIPQCVSMIRESFGQEHSAKAFGIFSPFISLSSALGPILGGALIDYASWRWVFLINPPVCVVVFFFSLRVLPAVPPRGDRPRLDVVGMILCSLAVGLFVYPIIQGREYDWAWWTFAMMIAAAGVLAVFALHARSRRRRSLDAFVEISLFRKRSFSGGTLTVFLFFGACSGAFIVNPLLLQLYIGWSPLHVGLTGSWWSLGTMSAMVAGPLLARRLRPRQVLQAGVLTQAVGMVLAALTVALNTRDTTHPGPHGPLLDTGLTSFNLAPALIVSGIGTGLFFVPFLALVLAAVDNRELGLANGAINSLQQLGGAVATAVFSTVIFNQVGDGTSPYTAGTLAYGLCACLLVVTWAASFTLGKTTDPHD